MISTARSSQAGHPDSLRGVLLVLGLMLALALPAAGQARQSDRDQPVNVTADQFDSQATPNGVTHLKGHVVLTQGTLKVTAVNATIYFDANSKVRRAVFTGVPARIRQQDDNGNLIKGHANTIDYDIPKGVATLTTNAHIQQQGRGSASGNRLVYNTRTSTMSASGSKDARVHLTFLPSQGTDAAPANASSTADKH